MAKKARQPYQYEPLVTPSTWKGDEHRFSIRLTQIIDDLYQKFGALKHTKGESGYTNWTEDDKKAVVRDVLSALPVYAGEVADS